MMRLAVLLAILLCSGHAAADLYRWVDPETGSVKFSSYPPPWYGDESQQRRAPKVEHIPARSTPSGPGAGIDFEQPAPPKPAAERKPGADAPDKPATGERPGT
jgi:hypothetical protein